MSKIKMTGTLDLQVWDKETYDHSVLAENLVKVDAHDQSYGRGFPIPTFGAQLRLFDPDEDLANSA